MLLCRKLRQGAWEFEANLATEKDFISKTTEKKKSTKNIQLFELGIVAHV